MIVHRIAFPVSCSFVRLLFVAVVETLYRTRRARRRPWKSRGSVGRCSCTARWRCASCPWRFHRARTNDVDDFLISSDEPTNPSRAPFTESVTFGVLTVGNARFCTRVGESSSFAEMFVGVGAKRVRDLRDGGGAALGSTGSSSSSPEDEDDTPSPTIAMNPTNPNPRVQLIVNAVSATRCADAVLALGGLHALGATTPEETRETASKSHATLVNFGTPTSEEIAWAALDARIVVVDPVGIGLATRGAVIKRWLEERRRRMLAAHREYKYSSCVETLMVTVIKGNRSEMEALLRLYGLGEDVATLGAKISSTPDYEATTESEKVHSQIADALCQLMYSLYPVTAALCTGKFDYRASCDWSDDVGECDFVTAGMTRETPSVSAFSKFSGAGCVLGAVLATHLAQHIGPGTTNEDVVWYVERAACMYRALGADIEQSEPSAGPTSFLARFMDRLAEPDSFRENDYY